jgi:hypothetical protein
MKTMGLTGCGKVSNSGEFGEKRPSGAEARAEFCRLYAGVKTPASLWIEFFRCLFSP